MVKEPLIPSHGGYRELRSYQLAQLVYDLTVRFCDRWINRRSRTHDQMVQAARSGVQNIAEGSQASGTSKKTELKLTNVARASLEELKLDFEDYLRQRSLELWPANDNRRGQLVAARCATADEVALWVKALVDRGGGGNGRDGRDGPNGLNGPNEPAGRVGHVGSDGSDGLAGSNGPDGRVGRVGSDGHVGSDGLVGPDGQGTSAIMGGVAGQRGALPRRTYDEAAANAIHVLIGVTCSLLDRQIRTLAREFEEHGGFTERLHRIRTEARKRPPKD